MKRLLRIMRVKWYRRRPGDMLAAFGFLGVIILLTAASFIAWKHYISTPPYIDSERFPIKGIDVSSHNGMMNLDAAAKDGISFIIMKATEGADFKDPNFALNYLKAGHAGLKRGAYHFFRFETDGILQAKNLLRATSGRPLELGLAIDVEEQGNPADVPVDSVVMRLQDMVDILIMHGHRVTFYSNRAGYEKYLFENFRGFPLWICSFDEDNAAANDWAIWQYSHSGNVAGIRGPVDLNVLRPE